MWLNNVVLYCLYPYLRPFLHVCFIAQRAVSFLKALLSTARSGICSQLIPPTLMSTSTVCCQSVWGRPERLLPPIGFQLVACLAILYCLYIILLFHFITRKLYGVIQSHIQTRHKMSKRVVPGTRGTRMAFSWKRNPTYCTPRPASWSTICLCLTRVTTNVEPRTSTALLCQTRPHWAGRS